MNKITISCDGCSAECTIIYEVDEPFKVSFCPFCSENIEKDLEWSGSCCEFEDDDFDDYEEYEK